MVTVWVYISTKSRFVKMENEHLSIYLLMLSHHKGKKQAKMLDDLTYIPQVLLTILLDTCSILSLILYHRYF